MSEGFELCPVFSIEYLTSDVLEPEISQEGEHAMELRCPVCEKDDSIQKVSAVFSGGVQAIGLETFSESAKGVTISRQSVRLAPPGEPKKPAGLHWLLWILGLIIGVVFLGGAIAIAITTQASGGEAGILGGLLYGAACGYPAGFVLSLVGLLVLHTSLLRGSKARYTRELPIWQAMMEVWNRLYYCTRDDVVFDPATRETAEPERLAALLARTPTMP